MAKSIYAKVLSKIEDSINEAEPHPGTLSGEIGNSLLDKRIRASTPFFAGRLGTTENNTLSWYTKYNKMLRLPFPHDLRHGSWQASGLFPPKTSTLRGWSELCEEALSLTDIYCSWDLPMDGYYKKRHLNAATFVELSTLDAFVFSEPWTLALEGLQVLVVHPFAETIYQQYSQKNRYLFERTVLPEFELKTVKTAQTLAGNTEGYGSWFDAFDRTREKIDRETFDIALVGAGSYGMPLSAHIRKSGKSVVYVGGVLQMLFGIRGARWDHLGLYNDAWIRPVEADRPSNYNVVEQGCYW